MDPARENEFGAAEEVLERIELTLPSTLEGVGEIERAAEELALRTGFDEEASCTITIAVREAAINASKHGNDFSKEKTIGVQLVRTAETLTVRISDQGQGMDPAMIPDPLEPANLLRDSGRGVFLMRAIMDEVHFRQLDPGTEVTLVKHRNVEANS